MSNLVCDEKSLLSKLVLTSNFFSVSKFSKELVPVAISKGKPRDFVGLSLEVLAPSWEMLKMEVGDYNRAYVAQLSRLDPTKILEVLPDRCVLLCWEKPGERCHRRLVAQWLEHHLDIEVCEFGFSRDETPRYQDSVEKGQLGKTTKSSASPSTPA